MSSIDRIVKQVIGGKMSADSAAAAIRKLPKSSGKEIDPVQNYYDNPDGRSDSKDIGIVMSSANIAGKLSDADYATLYGALSGK